MSAKTKHVCPPYCHPCPYLGGAILPGCTGTAVDSSCTCEMPCAECGRQAADYRCDWPMDKPTRAQVSEMQVGDVLVHPRHGRRITVIEIEADFPANAGLRRITARAHSPKKVVERKYYWDVTAVALVLRPGVCDEPTCESCAREAGEYRHYCPGHWNAWRDVA